MNNSTLFWRLAWKEYRMLRGFWIALALATVGLQLLIVVTRTLMNEPMTQLEFNLTGFGMVMVAFYALGCGATLFAVEREEETYEFLRTLPVSGGQAMRAKFAVAIASIVALWAFVFLESALVSGLRFLPARHQGSLWGVFGLPAVEALVWGTFFSLVLRRPISAVFAAAATGIVTVGLIVWWVVEFQSRIITGIEDMPVLTLYRVLLILAVAAANLWLAPRWFDEGLRVSVDSLWAGRTRHELRGSGIALGSLLWQQWRQSRLTMIVTMSLGVALVVWIFSIKALETGERRMPFIATATAMVTVIFSALAGANVFQADQSKQSFRFLAERGVRPAIIWFTRHLVWLAPVALWVAATAIIWLAVEARDWNSIAEALMKDDLNAVPETQPAMNILAGMGIVILGLAYCAGQYCSMFLRRGVVAWFFSLLLTGVLFYWAGIMDWLGISWVWSVAPIPLVLLVATWLRTPHWLLERTDRPARLQAALSVGVPAALLALAVIGFRVYQIPYADPGFSVAEFARPITPEEKATAEMYQTAAAMIKTPPIDVNEPETPEKLKVRQAEFVATNGPAMVLALEATARPHGSFFDDGLPMYDNPTPLIELGKLLVASASVLEANGDLDAAWDRYFAALQLSKRLRPDDASANKLEELVDDQLPGWAARPGQTKERIDRAIERLQKYYASLPPAADSIKAGYVAAMRTIDFDPELWRRAGATPHELRMQRIAMALVPWESARSRRLLNLATSYDLRFAESMQRKLEATSDSDNYALQGRPYIGDELTRTTLLPSSIPNYRADFDPLSTSTARRATLIVLALEAWKAKHGMLPATLGELMGDSLDKIPLDPYSGQSFRYLPEGLPKNPWIDKDPRWASIRPGQPLAWSTGPFVQVLEVASDGPKYRVNGGWAGWVSNPDDRTVWFSGVPFSVP